MASTYGARLKSLREQQGLSQKELAEQAAVDPSHISRQEAGKGDNPTWSVILSLAEVLGTSVDFLMGRTDSYDLHIHDMGFGEIRRLYLRNNQAQRRKMVASVRRHHVQE
jgi:transcriptional regulator with XRE-family HTH domain